MQTLYVMLSAFCRPAARDSHATRQRRDCPLSASFSSFERGGTYSFLFSIYQSVQKQHLFVKGGEGGRGYCWRNPKNSFWTFPYIHKSLLRTPHTEERQHDRSPKFAKEVPRTHLRPLYALGREGRQSLHRIRSLLATVRPESNWRSGLISKAAIFLSSDPNCSNPRLLKTDITVVRIADETERRNMHRQHPRHPHHHNYHQSYHMEQGPGQRGG